MPSSGCRQPFGALKYGLGGKSVRFLSQTIMGKHKTCPLCYLGANVQGIWMLMIAIALRCGFGL